jgi:LPXTG-motif cell wall-anchored protein
MPVARRLAAAFAVVGLGVLAYAVPASATESGAADTASTTTNTSSLPCVDGNVRSNLQLVVAAGTTFDATQGVAVVRGKGGAPICPGTDVQLTLSLYHVPDTWDGTPFPGGPGGRAWPQTELTHQSAVLKGDKPVTLTVPIPTCGNVQIDLYTGPPITEVGSAGHPQSKLIFAELWSIGGPNGHPAMCTPETTPPPTTTPAPTTSAPSSPAPPTTSPAVPPTTSAAAPVPPVATSPGTIPPAQPIVVATPPSVATTAPPVLASTGSSTTIPLLGLGAALLGAGIGLSLLGRRRKTA